MSNRKLLILGIVTGVMVILAAVQQVYIGRPPAKESGAGSYLIQGLEPTDIASIVIGKGEGAVRLVRRANCFVVGNKDDYPAVTKKVNNLLTSCLDIRTVEFITANPANHESLDVTEQKAQNVVKFLNKGGEIITGFVVGSSRLPEMQMNKRSTYVRLISSDDVYLAKRVPLLQSSAMDYIDKEIVNVERSDVIKVTVTGPEGSYTLRVEDSNDDNIVLENMSTGKKLKMSDCRQVAGVLSYLSFNDVKRKASFEEEELKFDTTYVSELKDSTVYTFELAKTDGKAYVKCIARYIGETREILESEGELKDKEAKLLARDQATDFTKKHKGWVYEISEGKAKNLTRKLTDLVEEEEEEEEEEAEEGEKAEEEVDKPSSTSSSEETTGEQPE